MDDHGTLPGAGSAARRLHGLYRVMVDAADPARVLPPGLPAERDAPARVIGAGKAAASMAAALDREWRGALEGWVVTPYGYAMPAGRVMVREAAHPLPDLAALAAGTALMEAAAGAAAAGDRLICLLSGGASSLACAPPPGVTLAAKREVLAALLHSGAGIAEINCVRKHLSLVKGGRMAQIAWPSPVLCLAISDVPGDDPSVIGSGPLSPDPSTREDAMSILRRFGVPLPREVSAWLGDPASESPGAGSGCFGHVDYRLLATPASALAAAADAARGQGMDVLDLGADLCGDAVELGRAHAHMALARLRAGWRGLILSGGETGVRVQGAGRGGRNSVYLAAVIEGLAGAVDVAGLAADTDGVDGTGGAGAWFDPGVLARAGGLAVSSCIRTSDTHTFFATLGSSLERRPTRTNVNDFRALLVGASAF